MYLETKERLRDYIEDWLTIDNEKDLKTTHAFAMELASKADLAKIEGNDEMYGAYIGWAFKFEKSAAESVRDQEDFEPTRSVLFRSAASLALESGNTGEAIRLAKSGLAGNPPDIVKEELKEILEKTKKVAT